MQITHRPRVTVEADAAHYGNSDGLRRLNTENRHSGEQHRREREGEKDDMLGKDAIMYLVALQTCTSMS